MKNPAKSGNQAANPLRVNNNPVPYPRTVRPDARDYRTSCRAGLTYPAAFIPLMPEDTVKAGSMVQIVINTEETERVTANAVNVRAHAYFVSFAALDRFRGMDSVADAWAGVAGAEELLPQYTYDTGSHSQFYNPLGEHIKDGEQINTLYVEAYNRVINYRRDQVSISLPERPIMAHSMARCLWGQTALSRIVSKFDAALEQAELQLQFSGANLPLKTAAGADVGVVAIPELAAGALYNTSVKNPDGTIVGGDADPDPIRTLYTKDTVGDFPAGPDLTGIYAELAGTAGGISIAQIDAARRTQAMARLRQTMSGNEDEYIDMLMRGFRIPNAAYRDPILIGRGEVTLGQAQRNATDGASLDTYVANGSGRLQLPIMMPQQSTGGVIIVTYEIIPSPVFDRQADMFLRETASTLPNALADYLDVQKVDIVPGQYVDALHTQHLEAWGYAPRNFRWSRSRHGVGGRFKRELTSLESDEDQMNIWSVRTVDPELDDDTFMVPFPLSHSVFKDAVSDPFILQITHSAAIEGITQFGPALYEAAGDYDAVAAIAPTTIIDGDAI